MYPQRLPIVDDDDGIWGDILRKYLEKEHYNDDNDSAANGGHKNVTIRGGTAGAGGAPLKFTSGTLLTTPEVGAMEFAGDNLYLTQTSGTTRKKIALYDDTSGATGDIYYRNASGYFTRLAAGTASQILSISSGLPSWQTLSKSSVGLGNVDNTSDTNKPISTATQTALDNKVTRGTVVWKIYATADYGSGVVDDVIDYSSYANAYQIAQRYDDGRLRVGTPVDTADATTKSYVDTGLAAKAAVSHTHAATDITSGTLAIARIPTGTTSSTVTIGNDARLTDTRTPTDNTVSTAKIQDSAVTSAKIADGTIVNADVNASAAIALSKLAAGYVSANVNGTATTTTVWRGTQAQYAAIGTKDNNTLYFISG